MSALYTFRHCYMWYFSIEGTGQVLDFKIVSEMHSRNPWVITQCLWALGFLALQSNPQDSFESGQFHGFESSVTHWTYVYQLSMAAVEDYRKFSGFDKLNLLRSLPQVNLDKDPLCIPSSYRKDSVLFHSSFPSVGNASIHLQNQQ